MANKDIIQELSDLGSDLKTNLSGQIYSVPASYFESLPEKVLEFVASDHSAWLAGLPKELPFTVPVGYFESLTESIIDKIRKHPDYQTSQEELESISPLLSGISKRPVYAVPEGYFENFDVEKPAKTQPRVVSITSRRWIRYAAAAVIIFAISMTGFMIFRNNHKDAAGRTLARLERDVKKIDDVKKTDSLIDLMSADLIPGDVASNHKAPVTDDVQKLLQDVSTDELKDFNDQSKDIEDVMMTN